VRFFGGWEYGKELLNEKDWVKRSYAGGVPMGGDLPPAKGKAPAFVVWAVKDPTSGNLDRIEIVKGWTKNGQSFEKIYDVVWAGDRKPERWTGRIPAIQSTVDVDNATYTNSVGAVELKTVWTDPEFDPSLHAFYYARTLEIPTPRWTTIQAKQVGIAPPDVVPATVQERAWSSPIWYSPGAEARKGAKAGTTVADLTGKGAKPLGDDDLKALLVGKSYWFRNTVTGGMVKARFDVDGNSIMMHVGKRAMLPSASGPVVKNAYQIVPTPYSIRNGRLVTMVGNTPIEVAVYKVGDTYYAARSNEFGYANYEMLAKGPANLVTLSKGEYDKESQDAFLHAKE
jgi:hypothetical protein